MFIVDWSSNFLIKRNISSSVPEAILHEDGGVALHASRIKLTNQVGNDNGIKRAFCIQEEQIYRLLEVVLGVLDGLCEK